MPDRPCDWTKGNRVDELGDALNRIRMNLGESVKALTARDNVLMVRVDDTTLCRLDDLVEAGVFRSRSESAAFLIAEGIRAQYPLFAKISVYVKQIQALRKELQDMVAPPGPGADPEPAT